MYLANQLDGKIFNDPSLLPSKTSYEKFLQTKVGAPLGVPSRLGHILVPSGHCQPASIVQAAHVRSKIRKCELSPSHGIAVFCWSYLQVPGTDTCGCC